MPSGRVKWFNSKKGYGFITLDEDSGKDVFLHVSSLEKSKFRILKENQKIYLTLDVLIVVILKNQKLKHFAE